MVLFSVKIPLPGSVEKVQGMLRALGYGPQLDEFDKSMNRAAEVAAPKAKAIFWDSIKRMSFTDVRQILDGGDIAATNYLESIGISIFDLAYQIVVAVMVLNVSKKDTLWICHQTKKLIRKLSGRFLLIIGNHSKIIIRDMILRNMKIRFRRCSVAARKAMVYSEHRCVFIAVVICAG